jgi:hypothetical protein
MVLGKNKRLIDDEPDWLAMMQSLLGSPFEVIR